MYKTLIGCTVTMALIAGHSQIHAANKPHHPEEMTVTSSRITMPLRQVGTSVSVLTATQIEERGYATVTDILRTLPSIGVSNNGGAGKQTTLRVRGEEGYRTKVFIDGIDMSDPTSTQVQPQIQHLLSADIQRIEVLRGPQGMMYGADAGGVINIITKKANEALQGGIGIDGGRYNSQQISGNIRGQLNAFDFSLMAGNLATDGFNARPSDNTRDNDGYDNTTVGLSMGVDISSHIRLQGIARLVEGESEFDNCFTSTFSATNDCESHYDQHNYRVDAIFDNGTWEHKLSYGYAETQRLNLSDKTDKRLDVEGQLKQLQYFGVYHFNEAGQLVFGIDWEENTSDNTRRQSERDQTGLYLEWQGNINDAFFYTAGVRNDDNDDFGSNTSYRLTVAYPVAFAPGHELKIKGTYGTGFRAPSLYEIAYNDNYNSTATNPLPALDQETSKGFDVGLELSLPNGTHIEAVYFQQKIDDEISFDLSSYRGYLQETGRSESQGIELSFEAPVTQSLTLHGNYTYNDTQNAQRKQRIRRPEHTVNLGVRVVTLNDKLKLNAYLRQVTDAVNEVYNPAIFASERVSLDDYKVLDINIAYSVTTELDIYVRGENVFDEHYEEITDYNTSGATAYTGVRYRF